MMIKVTSKGNWNQTNAYLNRMLSREHLAVLNKFGPIGVSALASATPKESSLTANSWTYEVESGAGFYKMSWLNTNVHEGANVAVLLQFGHGVRGGGYVQGRDFINPAMRPVFDQMADEMWKAVTR